MGAIQVHPFMSFSQLGEGADMVRGWLRYFHDQLQGIRVATSGAETGNQVSGTAPPKKEPVFGKGHGESEGGLLSVTLTSREERKTVLTFPKAPKLRHKKP